LNKYDLVSKIEKFAPLDTQDDWDNSGWIIDNPDIVDVKKIMLALTVTDKVVEKARNKNCDMIVAHHPLFAVPLAFRDIQIYSSHTPTDKALGGTTDTLLKHLGLVSNSIVEKYVRIVGFENAISVSEFRNKLEKISNNVRLVNNNGVTEIKKIGFCAGSGSEFINSVDVDAFVTGDLKYHTAVETDKVIFDIGHYESEILILNEFKNILGINVEFSDEKSPFI